MFNSWKPKSETKKHGVRELALNRVVQLLGQTVHYRLFRNRQRKRLALLVDKSGEVQVRVPWRVTNAQIVAFIHDNDQWLLHRLQQVYKALEMRPILKEGVMLPFLDSQLCVCYQKKKRPLVFREENLLWVTNPDNLDQTLENVLESWYRKQAKHHLVQGVQIFSEKIGVSFAKVVIRGQKSRWGSCSSKGTISLNWRLMFFPSSVVHYVVVHELCHLKHMNHSPKFWSMVANFVPNYREYKSELRTFQPPW